MRKSQPNPSTISSDTPRVEVEGTLRKTKDFKRLHPVNRASKHDVYNLSEICKHYNVTDQTVRNWLKAGLPRVPGVSEMLVNGGDLNAFHAARRKAAQKPLTLAQFLCLTCHEARDPVPGSVLGADPEQRTLRMQSECSVCGSTMFRVWSKASAEALQMI